MYLQSNFNLDSTISDEVVAQKDKTLTKILPGNVLSRTHEENSSPADQFEQNYWAGFEPQTPRLQDRRANHSAKGI